MYESYYGLREKAFRKTPDPRYLFLNETYEEALEQLLYAVDEMEIALLTGEVGSGKLRKPGRLRRNSGPRRARRPARGTGRPDNEAARPL